MKLRALMLFLLFVPAALAARDKSPTYRIPLPPKPDFSSMVWLLGDWTGQTVGHSPPGKVHLSISYGLDRRVMLFKEEISLAATKEAPAAKESSIGILSRDPSGHTFLFQVYSSTGFITRYRVNVSGAEIDFNPIGGLEPPPGWLSRRIVERSDIDGFIETVQLAPPQRPFFDHYTAAFRRATPSAKAKTPSSQKAESE
ncbi:MAG TPA: hypothetical protein VMW54_04315 [Terriglobia bacterium]|nr:hypothetical protein [Terriglobia bacterium]